jgi:hypothetical protein
MENSFATKKRAPIGCRLQPKPPREVVRPFVTCLDWTDKSGERPRPSYRCAIAEPVPPPDEEAETHRELSLLFYSELDLLHSNSRSSNTKWPRGSSSGGIKRHCSSSGSSFRDLDNDNEYPCDRIIRKPPSSMTPMDSTTGGESLKDQL